MAYFTHPKGVYGKKPKNDLPTLISMGTQQDPGSIVFHATILIAWPDGSFEYFNSSGSRDQYPMETALAAARLYHGDSDKPFEFYNESTLNFQTHDQDEYCQTWILFFAYCRTVLECPAIHIRDIVAPLSDKERVIFINKFWGEVLDPQLELEDFTCATIFDSISSRPVTYEMPAQTRKKIQRRLIREARSKMEKDNDSDDSPTPKKPTRKPTTTRKPAVPKKTTVKKKPTTSIKKTTTAKKTTTVKKNLPEKKTKRTSKHV